jgi:hypothetical protein
MISPIPVANGGQDDQMPRRMQLAEIEKLAASIRSLLADPDLDLNEPLRHRGALWPPWRPFSGSGPPSWITRTSDPCKRRTEAFQRVPIGTSLGIWPRGNSGVRCL